LIEDCSSTGQFTIWGLPALGLDLRKYTTQGRFHFLGAVAGGVDFFVCTFDAETQSLTVGVDFAERFLPMVALVDVESRSSGTAVGDFTSATGLSCASSLDPTGVMDAPRRNSVNGIEAADALCKAMGYLRGQVLEETGPNDAPCPEVHALDANGKNWTSDLIPTSGAGRLISCTGFDPCGVPLGGLVF
jgi:hypothetical protein